MLHPNSSPWIRRVTGADIPAIIALERQAPSAAHWAESAYEAISSTAVPQRIALVIETDRILGFLVARELNREWEIENIVVDVASRGQGLGKRLLNEFQALAKKQNAESCVLEVRVSNVAARRLYEGGGFVESGRRRAYYREPEEDAILYRFSFE